MLNKINIQMSNMMVSATSSMITPLSAPPGEVPSRVAPLRDVSGISMADVHPDILACLDKGEECIRLGSNKVLTYDAAKERLRCLFINSSSKASEVIYYNRESYLHLPHYIPLSDRWKLLVESRDIIGWYDSQVTFTDPTGHEDVLNTVNIYLPGVSNLSMNFFSSFKLSELVSLFQTTKSFNDNNLIWSVLISQEHPEIVFQEILKHLSDEQKYNLLSAIANMMENYNAPSLYPFIRVLVKNIEIRPEDIMHIIYCSEALGDEEWAHIYSFVEEQLHPDAAATCPSQLSIKNHDLLVLLISGSIKSKNPIILKKLLDCLTRTDYFRIDSWTDPSGVSVGKKNYIDFLTATLCENDLNCIRVLLEKSDAFSSRQVQISVMKSLSALAQSSFAGRAEREEYLSKRLQIIDFLLSCGLDKDLTINGYGGIPDSLAECYFFNKNPIVLEMALHLIKRGCAITRRIERQMKLELKQHPEYIDLLRGQGKITDEEIRTLIDGSAPVFGPRESLMATMSEWTPEIGYLMRRYTANPRIRDFEPVNRCRQLKKEAKRYLISHPEDGEFKTIYTSFCNQYDHLVESHYVLSSLRKASRDLRRLSSMKEAERVEELEGNKYKWARLRVLFSFWHPSKTYTSPSTNVFMSTIDRVSSSVHWNEIRTNCLKYLQQVNRDSFWRTHSLICVHGTRLNPDMIKERGLVPMGMINREDGVVVPFCGQHIGSMEGTNKRHVSCSRVGQHWSNYKHLINDANTPLMTSMLYAKQEYSIAEAESVFDYEKAKEKITWPSICKNILGERVGERIEEYYSDILRLRAWDTSLDFSALLLKVEEALGTTTLSPAQRFCLEKIREALTIKIKYPLNEEDRRLIQMKTPILFGTTSSTAIPIELFASHKDWEEVLLSGSQMFERDIQVAFVEESDLEDVSSRINPLGVKVYSFETSYAIETEKMMREESKLSGSKQQALSSSLELDILPAYGRLFPEHPNYANEAGETLPVTDPSFGGGYASYADYKKAVQETSSPARHLNGKMHAVRTSIAAQMWSHFYQGAMGSKMEGTPYLLGMAAAAHDSQRQEEGKELWNGASGQVFKNYLATQGYSEDLCRLYSHAIAEKNPHTLDGSGHPLFTSNVQRYIHDADSIEDLRVKDKSEFDINSLAFVQEWQKYKTAHATDAGFAAKAAAVDAELPILIDEWDRFAKLTENDSFKLTLEYTPGLLYYSQVMKVLQTRAAEFPLLAKYLKTEIDEIKRST